jgi:hypothetical protein
MGEHEIVGLGRLVAGEAGLVQRLSNYVDSTGQGHGFLIT